MVRSVVRVGRCVVLGVLLVATTLMVAPAAQADVLQVTTTADPVPGGCAPDDCSLREAVIAANNEVAHPGRDVIVLGEGLHELDQGGGPEDDSMNGDLDVTSEVVILGSGVGSSRSTVEQQVMERVFHVLPGGSLVLRDLAVQGGTSENEPGGGVLNEGTLVLRDAIVRDNTTTADGGGVANDGVMFAFDSRIVHNHATDDGDIGSERGGGIINDGLNAVGELTVVRSTISQNSAPSIGGGIFDQGGTVEVTSSTLADNQALGGGGMRISGQLRMRGSTISGNTVDQHGAGIESFGDLQVVDSTISGNVAALDGGGLKATTGADEDTVLVHVTITDNVADSDADNSGNGGGIRVGGALGEVQVTLRSSIVSGNTDGSVGGFQVHDCSGPTGDPPPFTTLGFNVHGDGNYAEGCFPDPEDSDTNVVDLPLGPLADNGGPSRTHRVLPGTAPLHRMPAAEPGCAGRDQRGVPRPYGPGCDSGAYELARCRGRTINVVGTLSDDKLRGTAGPDGVLAFAGDDAIATFGGSDCIIAGPGDDVVSAGGGRDVVFGQAGDDVLAGGGGDDALIGGPGDDRLSGQPGDDSLFGQTGADRLFGHAGDDRLNGGLHVDVCEGGAGADTLVACP